MARIIVNISILLILLFGCNQKENSCQNRFDLINATAPIPILDLFSYSSAALVHKKMIELYGEEECDCNAELPIKIPFQFDLGAGYLNLILILEEEYDPTCPIICGVRPNEYAVTINRKGLVYENQFYEVIELDTVSQRLFQYYSTVGKNDDAPFNFKKAGVGISLYSINHKVQLKDLFEVIEDAYISFINAELEKEKIDFCNLTNDEIEELKKKYPLNIRLTFNDENNKSVPPPPLILEEIEVNDLLIELSPDINLEDYLNE